MKQEHVFTSKDDYLRQMAYQIFYKTISAGQICIKGAKRIV